MSATAERVDVCCPKCGKRVSMRREKFAASIGKQAKCGDCSTVFTIQPAAAELPPPASVPVVRRPPPLQPDTIFVDIPAPAPAPLVRMPDLPPTPMLYHCYACTGNFDVSSIYSLGGDRYICHRCHHGPASQQTMVPAAPMMAPAYAPAAAAGQPIVINNNINNVVGHYEPPMRWSPGVAALLSFLLPGLGQMYKGQPINGIAWFLLTAVGYVFLIIPGLILHLCCILGAASGDPRR